jgi:hypothetical protein
MGYGIFSTFGRTRHGALRNLKRMREKFSRQFVGYPEQGDLVNLSGLYCRNLTPQELDDPKAEQRAKDLWIAGAHFDK